MYYLATRIWIKAPNNQIIENKYYQTIVDENNDIVPFALPKESQQTLFK